MKKNFKNSFSEMENNELLETEGGSWGLVIAYHYVIVKDLVNCYKNGYNGVMNNASVSGNSVR